MQVKDYLWISDDEYHYTSSYYTDNRWLDNDTVIVARSKEQEISKDVELVKFSLKDMSKEVICKNVYNFTQYVVHDGKIYYIEADKGNLMVTDAKTKETKLVWENKYVLTENGVIENGDGEIVRPAMPSITNDGKTMTVFFDGNNVASVMVRIDVETGKGEKVYEKKFEKPFYVANHVMICPENRDLIFFAHEGDTFYVSNRLWLYDIAEDKAWNPAKQHLDADGNLGDCFGHEMWAPSGKGLYFVKYPCSPQPPRGVCYVDVKTGKTELLYSGYKYWHVGSSSDEKFLTADTQHPGYRSEVIIINLETNEEFMADDIKITGKHPCHPHPQMSPDSKKVIYTCLNEKGKTCAKIAILD